MQQRIVLLASLAAAFSVISPAAQAQNQADIAVQQLQRQQQREKAQNDKAEEQRPDVRLPRAQDADSTAYPLDEKPCFAIRHIELSGDSAAQFAWALKAADDAIGLCLGSGGINAVLAKVQNALVSAGYVTTRVLAAPQDLTTGRLALALVPGRVHGVRFAAPADQNGPSWRTAVPSRPGDILNLRDIEQALENC